MTPQRGIEVFGWIGTGFVFLAYALNSFGAVDIHDVSYQALNLVGALGIALVSLRKNAYQPAVLNAIWALIALAALTKAALA